MNWIPEFAHPWLLLLAVPAALALWVLWRKKQPSLKIPSIAGIREVNRHSPSVRYKKLIPFVLYGAAALLTVLALARPREGLEQIRRRSEGIDIVIALDISGSMRATDVPAGVTTRGELENGISSGRIVSRLDSAKREIVKFINERPNDRIGLIAFAPKPYTACPPTLDHAWLIGTLNALHPGMIGDMTNIAGPIAAGIRKLKDSDAKRRIIVLFTDGANNIADRVSPRQAAKLANTFDITVYTVGIGSANAVMTQNTPFGAQIVPVQNDFDEPLLRDMAELSGGKYYRAEDSESMAKAMAAISALEKTTFEQQTLVNWRELAPRFAALAAAFLLLGFLLETAVWPRIP